METQGPLQCVGFIMDGNRRWARKNNVSTLEGHRHGYETFRTLVDVVYRKNIPHLVCYAFSTENWNRAQEEVGYLINLAHFALRRFVFDLKKFDRSINLKIIGERDRLPKNLQKEIERAEMRNTQSPHLTVWAALSYGGRSEIVAATNRAVALGKSVTGESFAALLSTAGMPDPDLIIRTGEEQRLSNFLLWQSAYSELFFTDTLWPDFGEAEFQSILEQYAKRERRSGV